MITKITFAPLLNSFEALSADNHDTYNTFFHLRCCLYHSSHILTEAGLVLTVFSSFLMCFGLLLFLWFYPPIQSFLLLNPSIFFYLFTKDVFLSSVRNAPDVFYPMKCTRTVCAHNRNRVRRAPRFEVVQKEEKWRQLCLCVHLVECVLIKWAYSRLIIAQVNAVYKLFKIKKCYYLIKRHISGLDVRKC